MPITLSKRLGAFLNARNISGNYDSRQSDVRPYLGELLMPIRRIDGMEMSRVVGRSGPPVTLRPSALDAAAPIRPRLRFSTLSNEMPFYRESMVLGEKDRQALRSALARGDQYVTQVLERIFDDTYNLVLGADASMERMRMRLLETGEISIDIDGMPYMYDYGFDASTQYTTIIGARQWSNPSTSDPMNDLTTAKQLARLGATARVLMTENTYQQMLQSAAVKGYMFPASAAPNYVLPQAVAEFMSAALGITFVVLDDDANIYRERVDGADQQMYSDGIVTLLPGSGAIGYTGTGTTPEESDLLGEEKVDVSVTSKGVAVATQTEYGPPVKFTTTASFIGLPDIDRIDKMHILNVNGGAGG